jgi:hypothetical protein
LPLLHKSVTQNHETYDYEKVGINQSITRGRHTLVRTAGQTTYLTNQLLKMNCSRTASEAEIPRVLQKKCVNNYCYSRDSDIPTPRKSACIRPSQRA